MQAGTGAVKQAHTGGLDGFCFGGRKASQTAKAVRRRVTKMVIRKVIRRVIRKPGAGDALVSISASIRRMEDYDENYQGERL